MQHSVNLARSDDLEAALMPSDERLGLGIRGIALLVALWCKAGVTFFGSGALPPPRACHPMRRFRLRSEHIRAL